MNTNQGAQFTSRDLTNLLSKQGVSISMDGKGRAIDNVVIERLWRTFKYEEIYLKESSVEPIFIKGSRTTSRFTDISESTVHFTAKRPAEVYRSGRSKRVGPSS